MSPPTDLRVAFAAPPNRATRTGGRDGQQPAHLSVETLTRQAHKVMADLDIAVGPSRLSKIIRRFVREGRGDVDFRTWFIAYADPTGETAVRNVMRRG